MKYNIDETETKSLRKKAANLNKNIEKYVVSQEYKKASELKIEQAKYEKQINNIKAKFSIPKNKRFTVSKEDVQKVLSIST